MNSNNPFISPQGGMPFNPPRGNTSNLPQRNPFVLPHGNRPLNTSNLPQGNPFSAPQDIAPFNLPQGNPFVLPHGNRPFNTSNNNPNPNQRGQNSNSSHQKIPKYKPLTTTHNGETFQLNVIPWDEIEEWERTEIHQQFLRFVLPRIVEGCPTLQAAIRKSVKLRYPEIAPLDAGVESPNRLRVKILPIDVLHAASLLHKLIDARVGVQNFCDEQIAGGKFAEGSKFQEASICIRSTLMAHLKSEFYQGGLKQDELKYSPDVVVFSLTATQRLRAEGEFKIDVISCPAPRNPEVHPKKPAVPCEQYYVNAKDYQLMAEKIKSVLSVAAQAGCHGLVLGDFGCGGFKNPIRDVSRILRDTLRNTDWVAAGLDNVVIAIPPTTNAWPVFLSEFEQDVCATDGPEVDIDYDGMICRNMGLNSAMKSLGI